MESNLSAVRRVLAWGPVVIWMMLIFYMSAQPAGASNGMSTGLTMKVLSIAEEIGFIDVSVLRDEVKIGAFNNNLRQFAHGFSYFVLALFTLIAYRLNGYRLNAYRKDTPPVFSVMLQVFLICAIYALSDEIHQIFVPGRAFQLEDLITDCSGALTAIILYIKLMGGSYDKINLWVAE